MSNKTWRLHYPDGTESLMNYNPIKHERQRAIKLIEQFETDNHLRIKGKSIRSLIKLKKDISAGNEVSK